MKNSFRILGLSIAVTFIVLLGSLAFMKLTPAFPLTISSVVSDKGNTFQVSGEGKTSVKPDVAEVTVGVTKTATTVSSSQNQANTVINSVTDAMKQLGIAEKDIKTISYQIYPEYNYTGTRKLTGYTTSVNVLVKVRDFQKIDQVIDKATVMGANEVSGLTFTIEDMEKVRTTARKEAIDNAKKKAQEIAKEAGITLGRIVNVSENAGAQPAPRLYMAAESATKDAGGTNVQPGESEVNVTVTLSYETR